MIKYKEKIGYGMGDMASSMFWKLFGAYLMIFYTDVFGLPAAVVGTMFLVTRIWDSAFDPIVGAVADRTCSRWGKFRPYLLFMAVPFGIVGVMTFTTPDTGIFGKTVYAYVTYSLMMMVYSGINVPYASLLGVMSSSPAERNVLSSYRMVFAYAGSFIALLVFMPLVHFFGGKLSGQDSWQAASAVMALMCVCCFYACFACTRERVRPVESKQGTLLKDVADLMRNRPWWILLGMGVSALVFNSVRDGAAVYYFKYFVGEYSYPEIRIMGVPFVLSGLYLAVGQAANILGVVLAAPISNRIGKKNTYMLAMSVASVLSVIFYWVGKDGLILMFSLQVLISVCAGSVFPLLWSMYADCADYSEFKTGRRATGLIFSSSSMSQKFGWAVGSALTGWLLAYFGFKANQTQSAEALDGIRMFLSILPAAGTALSVVFAGMYPLSEARMRIITRKLERKRDGNI